MAVTLNASTSSGFIATSDTSGSLELQANGTSRLTVASGGITTTGSTSISNLTATGTFGGGVITSGTSVASTSGTSVDISTTIPSWVKRVTVMFNGISTSGTSNIVIQIGSTTFTTSGYSSGAMVGTASSGTVTNGFCLTGNNSGGSIYNGNMFICSFGSNTWTASGSIYNTGVSGSHNFGGVVTLGGALDRVRITTVGGTDTFDAGSINILYEG